MGKVIDLTVLMQSALEPTVLFDLSRMVTMLIYVDDLLLIGPRKVTDQMIEQLKGPLALKVVAVLAKDGDVGWLLGREIRRRGLL